MAAPEVSSSLNPSRFAMGAVFAGGGDESTFLAFHRLGQYCASATADGALKLIDAVNGCVKKTVHCRKYGVAAGCFAQLGATKGDGGSDAAITGRGEGAGAEVEAKVQANPNPHPNPRPNPHPNPYLEPHPNPTQVLLVLIALYLLKYNVAAVGPRLALSAQVRVS